MLFKPRTLALILALILSVAGAYGSSFYGASGGSSGSSGFSAKMNAAMDDTVSGRIVMNDGDLSPEFCGYGSFSESHYIESTDKTKYAEVRASVSGDAQNYHYYDELGSAADVYAKQWLTADHASSIYGYAFAKNGANAAAVITKVTGGSVSGTATSPSGFGKAYFMGALANAAVGAKAVQDGSASGSKVVLDGFATDGTNGYNIKTIIADPSWCSGSKATYTGTTTAQSVGSSTSAVQTIGVVDSDNNAKLTVEDTRYNPVTSADVQKVTLTHYGNFAPGTLVSANSGRIIQNMVDFAKGDDSIGIGKGKYTENVYIDKNLKISGSGACGSCDGSGCGGSCGGCDTCGGCSSGTTCGDHSSGCTSGGDHSSGCGDGDHSSGCGTGDSHSGGCSIGYSSGCGDDHSSGCSSGDSHSKDCSGGDGSSTCGTIVDGSPGNLQQKSVFTIASGANVELSNMKITNGKAENGGGIHNEGTLNLHDSVISNNLASDGAGIFNMGKATIKDSTIYSNDALLYGGGISNENLVDNNGNLIKTSQLTLTNTEVCSNTAKYGGGIFNWDGNLDVSNSLIKCNTATKYGGGIGNWGTASVYCSSISGNKAEIDGGGIYNAVQGHDSNGNMIGGKLTVTSTEVSCNRADWMGGGIFNCDGDLLVINSNIKRNSAVYGGGLHNGKNAVILCSTIADNTAEKDGGGVTNWLVGTMSIGCSSIISNTANENGGGVYNLGTVTLTNDFLSLNHADDSGGAIYNEGTANVKNDIITQNTADKHFGGIDNEASGHTIYTGVNFVRANLPIN